MIDKGRRKGTKLDGRPIFKEVQQALQDVSVNLAVEDNFLIVKSLVLSDELREKMHEKLFEVVSSYAELSERYFTDSQHPAFQLVTCDYQLKTAEVLADIINVSNLA